MRKKIGKINAKFIDVTDTYGVISIYPWQLKLFKCVSPDDFFIITGIYDALIKTGICSGYKNFGANEYTNEEIANILISNYKWNHETMFGGKKDAIRFSWLNYNPVDTNSAQDWVIIWDSKDIKLRINKLNMLEGE